VPAVAISTAGGWQSVTSNLAAQDPGLLSMWHITDSGLPGWIVLVSFLGIGLPFLGVPQLMVRFMSAKDEDELKKARILSVIVILLFDVGAVTAGMAGRALFPGLDDAETIFPLLSSELFPPLITGVLMVVVLSAIMSTVDSLLLLASSAVVRAGCCNIHGRWLAKCHEQPGSPGSRPAEHVAHHRQRIAGMDCAGQLFSAWSGLGAAFGPVIICMLYYKRTTLPGVAAGMLGGFLTSVIWVVVFKADTYELYEMIPGFIVGMTLTLLVSRITRER